MRRAKKKPRCALNAERGSWISGGEGEGTAQRPNGSAVVRVAVPVAPGVFALPLHPAPFLGATEVVVATEIGATPVFAAEIPAIAVVRAVIGLGEGGGRDGEGQGGCSGQDAGLIPNSVALEHVLIYKQVSSAEFHGACFEPNFTPINGVVDVLLTTEVPYIPTKQHEWRAADALARLVGLDLTLESSLGPANVSSGAFQPRTKEGYCMMGIVSAP